MASYWIVVPRGNAELFELLSMAFKGDTGFSVIEDRRTAGEPPAGADMRARSDALGPDEIVVAERTERAATSSDDHSALAGMPLGRPSVRRTDQRLFTL